MDVPDHLIAIAAKTPDAHVADAQPRNLRDPGIDGLRVGIPDLIVMFVFLTPSVLTDSSTAKLGLITRRIL